jgi:hypothetical protein
MVFTPRVHVPDYHFSLLDLLDLERLHPGPPTWFWYVNKKNPKTLKPLNPKPCPLFLTLLCREDLVLVLLHSIAELPSKINCRFCNQFFQSSIVSVAQCANLECFPSSNFAGEGKI